MYSVSFRTELKLKRERPTVTGKTVLDYLNKDLHKNPDSSASLQQSINWQDLGCLLFEKLLLSAAAGAKITPEGD